MPPSATRPLPGVRRRSEFVGNRALPLLRSGRMFPPHVSAVPGIVSVSRLRPHHYATTAPCEMSLQPLPRSESGCQPLPQQRRISAIHHGRCAFLPCVRRSEPLLTEYPPDAQKLLFSPEFFPEPLFLFVAPITAVQPQEYRRVGNRQVGLEHEDVKRPASLVEFSDDLLVR